MAENKYQSVESEDIRGRRPEKRKKKKNKVIVILALLLALFIGISGAEFLFINSYLNKINYGDTVGEVNPELDKEEEVVEFEGKAEADEAIEANLNDNTLWYNSQVYNILLVGVDLGEEEKVMFEGAYLPRSDSMMILSINSSKNIINLVSLSRASYVSIPGHGNKRLNTAHAYGGAKMLVQTVEENYKIKIDRYITVDMANFPLLINALGGVSVDLTSAEAGIVIGSATSGTYNLNGDQALAYSRIRSIDNDRTRTSRQRKVIEAIATKFRQSSIKTLISLVDDVLPMVTTNFTKTEIISQAAKAPTYLKMQINEDIIPHTPYPLSLRDGKEVLILNWDVEKKYAHNLLYSGLQPETYKEK